MRGKDRHKLEIQFAEFVLKRGLLPSRGATLLAVSGGLDSMVMMYLYYRLGYDFAVAHCNFQLRGEESQRDEKFVRQEAHYLKVPVYVRRFDTRKYVNQQRQSLQVVARQLRYNFFKEICKRHGFMACATAHHADDNAETFFIHLLRGTGLAGETGIPLKQDLFVRPLLFATREVLKEYALQTGIEWREDSSNESDTYLRNRIRHQLFPVLDTITPSFRQAIERHIENMQGVRTLYHEYLDLLRSQHVQSENSRIFIDRQWLAAHPAALTLTFEFLHPYGFNRQTVMDVYRALYAQPGKKFYSSTHELITERNQLMVKPIKTKTDHQYQIEPDWHHFSWEGGSLTFRKIHLTYDLKEKIMAGEYKDPNIMWADASRIKYPLVLRKWRRGDEFHPLGMKGRKKLSDFFTDLKLSASAREKTWLLLSDDRILWVIGYRPEHAFRITEQSTICMEIIFDSKK
jgi:tRNA(Ile)-lysidine synthase